MSKVSDPDRYLYFRGGRWYYNRRTPGQFLHVESRTFLRYSLKTKSHDVARMRRDALELADNAYWEGLSLEAANKGGVSDVTSQIEKEKYESASKRAMALGFSYASTKAIADDETLEQILRRLKELESRSGSKHVAPEKVADALLGAVEAPKRPNTKVSEAFEIYLEKIAFGEQYNKSPKQRYSWAKTKKTSINYFIENMGDLYMEEITRDQAMSYRNWWLERLQPGANDGNPTKPNTANRHIGNMRKLYEAFFTHIGEEDRTNPFRKMFFKGKHGRMFLPLRMIGFRTRF